MRERLRVMRVACLLVLAGLCLPGCAGRRANKGESPTLDDLLSRGARIMWVGAHPDDESLVGSVLAKAGATRNCTLYFLVLTHGEGGECNLPEGCHPDVYAVRGEEMKEVARLYGAQLELESFYNAPLPVESFPPRHEIARKWLDQGDPALEVARAIREFKPDVLFTFDPDHGFTGHPEHQLASRFATRGVTLAADPNFTVDDLPPFRVVRTYYAVNRYWPFVLLGKADPGPYSETFDARQSCREGVKCREVMAEFTRPHKTQARDMGSVRRLQWLIDRVYLYRVDPWAEPRDPLEPVSHGGLN